eukprot:228917-Pleurochrysis_carterae.AAC.1
MMIVSIWNACASHACVESATLRVLRSCALSSARAKHRFMNSLNCVAALVSVESTLNRANSRHRACISSRGRLLTSSRSRALPTRLSPARVWPSCRAGQSEQAFGRSVTMWSPLFATKQALSRAASRDLQSPLAFFSTARCGLQANLPGIYVPGVDSLRLIYCYVTEEDEELYRRVAVGCACSHISLDRPLPHLALMLCFSANGAPARLLVGACVGCGPTLEPCHGLGYLRSAFLRRRARVRALMGVSCEAEDFVRRRSGRPLARCCSCSKREPLSCACALAFTHAVPSASTFPHSFSHSFPHFAHSSLLFSHSPSRYPFTLGSQVRKVARSEAPAWPL